MATSTPPPKKKTTGHGVPKRLRATQRAPARRQASARGGGPAGAVSIASGGSDGRGCTGAALPSAAS
eukprot:534092-Pyramimonas_sp.AAC.1